jgi:hypothetical protein
MRLSMFILGVFAAIVCTEKSAEAEQNYLWCSALRGCVRFVDDWSNAWLTGSGKAGPVDPVRTRPRRNHLRQLASEVLSNFAKLTAIRRAFHVS